MAFSFSPKIVTNGLVLALDAANTRSYVSGSTVWNDLTANRNNGTLTNGPTYSSANAGGIQFDGIDDYVQYSHNNTLNFPNAISLCFWFKTSESIDGYLTTKSNDSFYFCVGPAGVTQAKLSFFANNVTGNWIQSSRSVNDNNWTFGIATWNGTTVNLFINGVLDTTVQRSGTMAIGSNVMTIGARLGSGIYNGYFKGSISYASYYNRALSPTEVLQNYNATKSRFNLT